MSYNGNNYYISMNLKIWKTSSYNKNFNKSLSNCMMFSINYGFHRRIYEVREKSTVQKL